MFYIEYLHEVIDIRTYSNTGILLWIVSIIVNKHLACFVLENGFISIFFSFSLFSIVYKRIMHIFVVVVWYYLLLINVRNM